MFFAFRIHDLLQLRCKYARTIAKVYTFAAEYIENMTDLDQPKVCLLINSADHVSVHF